MDRISSSYSRLECDPYLGFIEREYVTTHEVKRLTDGSEAVHRTITCNGFHRHSDWQGIGKPGECRMLRGIYRSMGLAV